jgi:hypothetical protein
VLAFRRFHAGLLFYSWTIHFLVRRTDCDITSHGNSSTGLSITTQVRAAPGSVNDQSQQLHEKPPHEQCARCVPLAPKMALPVTALVALVLPAASKFTLSA